jgi:hypothetical protein
MPKQSDLVADTLAVTSVLAFRLPMLLLSAYYPTTARKAETTRMVTEKVDAAVAGTLAAQAFWMTWPLRMWSSQGGDPFDEAYEAFVAPGRRTLRANARRLRRRRHL